MKKNLILLLTLLAVVSCKQEAQVPAATDEAQTISDVMMSRRSIRKYKDYRIGRDTLDIILTMGVNAPNGQARQAYEVKVIDNPALIQEISDAVVQENPKIGERPGFKNIFVNAPCVVFIAADRTYDMSQVDCGLLGENIILSAWSMGIGSCCLGSSARMMKTSEAAAPYLQRLGFSADYELLYCIGLGYPDETPDAKPRKEGKVAYID